jgi:hypothetical protein
MQVALSLKAGWSSTEAVVTSYPTLLQDMINPRIMGYPVESVVAEKFHAMGRYAEVPSRWKDYYDIWLISENFELDDQSLQNAIAKTFEKRNTTIPDKRPISLSVEFAAKYRENWNAFLGKFGLENPEIDELAILVEKVWGFLGWPLQALSLSDAHQEHRHWRPREKKWRSTV